MMTEKEIWKPVKGYEELYSISNFGNVKSHHTRMNGNFLKPGFNGNYFTVILCKERKSKHFYVHVLVAETFIGAPPSATYNFYTKKYIPYVVNHKDGNKQNNTTENLKWVTKQEDLKHAYRLGLNCSAGWPRRIGEAHSRAKLSEKDVLEIRELIKCGKFTQKQLAEKFDVDRSTVYLITTRKNWSHI